MAFGRTTGKNRTPHDVLTHEAAVAAGRRFYKSDSPCPVNHKPMYRYINGGQCVTCKLEMNKIAKRRRAKAIAGGHASNGASLKVGPWDHSWGHFEDHPKAPKKEPPYREGVTLP